MSKPDRIGRIGRAPGKLGATRHTSMAIPSPGVIVFRVEFVVFSWCKNS